MSSLKHRLPCDAGRILLSMLARGEEERRWEEGEQKERRYDK